MKHKKATSKKNDSLNSILFRVFIIGFVCIALYLILSSRNTTPKITPEITQSSICSSERYPVCGKDGKTYANSCTAEKITNVRVAYTGECREEKAIKEDIITATPTVETGTVVDSGIANIGPVPTFMTDRTNTGVIIPPLSQTGTTETLSGNTNSLSGQSDPTWMSYSNSTYHYSFSMPKKSYYQAFGAQNGANHALGISTGTGVTSLAESQVRVYFYANKVLDKLS